MKCLRTLQLRFVLLRLLGGCLLFCFIMMISGCNMPTKEGQDKQRYSLEQISLSTKASADILGKANKEVDGVDDIITALNNNFKNIPKPAPFEWPDWLKYLLYGGLALLAPGALNHSAQQGKGIFGILGKVLGSLANGNKKDKK